MDRSAPRTPARRGFARTRAAAIALAIVPMAAAFVVCYGAALFGGRQFAYRDAGHYYYPLHQRVQREWSEGRWPLWEPEENAGMPLLGNPTAAVFYPGKLVFAMLPYPWAARVYVVAHTALAWAAMLVLMRGWGASGPAASLSALAYAFAAPVLFQSCNIIFLVGAAWLPLGLHAVDRWVRQRRLGGLLELAAVLAMQALGGDPETAYLLGWAAVAYALIVARSRNHAEEPVGGSEADRPRPRRGRWVLAVLALGAWFVATAALGAWLPVLRPAPAGGHTRPLPWMTWMPQAVAMAWAAAAFGFLLRWRRSGRRSPLGMAWTGLALAAVLAIAVSAVQLLPAFEFTRRTQRSEQGGQHDVYPFSLEPFRLAELAWPNVFGSEFGEQTSWANALRLPGTRPLLWVPSLYAGALTLVLAVSAGSIRRGPPWRAWLSAIALVSLVGALGQFGSPIWAARAAATLVPSPPSAALLRQLGPLDPSNTRVLRDDGRLRDGDGSPYWWMTQLLPGFRQFRFPSKLLVFTMLALAALAGIGWDDAASGGRKRTIRLLSAGAVVSLVIAAAVVAGRPAILRAFQIPALGSIFGPFDAPGAFVGILRSLVQAASMCGIGVVALRLARTRPSWAGALVVVAIAVDLVLANARYVVTVPQATLDAPAEAAEVIAAAERQHPSPGPYRVHRMAAWAPPGWRITRSPDRGVEMTAWEVDTVQSKYGILRGLEYVYSLGVGELADFSAFFRGFRCPVADPEAARRMQLAPGQPIVYFPRRSFDLWNTRYFVVPLYPADWNDEQRASAAFVYRSERIYPTAEQFAGSGGDAEYRRFTGLRDFQVLRNDQAYPRAWIVHAARPAPAAGNSNPEERRHCLDEITYARDLWRESGLSVHDPHAVAWIDRQAIPGLAHYLRGHAPGPRETVRVTYPDPQHAELVATLDSPGIVVLSDVDYPGWELTIDGRPAPIHTVNLAMRGAAVEAGTHRLVYAYRPRSFLIGGIISLFGLAAWVSLGVMAAVRRPRIPDSSGDASPNAKPEGHDEHPVSGDTGQRP